MIKLSCVIAVIMTVAWPLHAETYRLNKQGFITDWLIRGPYPNYQTDTSAATGGMGFDTDFLVKSGGETQAVPRIGTPEKVEFVADFSKLVAGLAATNEWGSRQTAAVNVDWQPLHLKPGENTVTLDKKFGQYDDYIVIYAACTVYSPNEQQIKVRVGSDDDNKVWLNGQLIGSANSSQGIIPDNFIYAAKLKKGLNRLLVKVVDRTGGFGFCLGLSDDKNVPLNNAVIYLDSPAERLIDQNADLKSILDWDNGYFLATKSTKEIMTGAQRLDFVIGTPEAGNYQLQARLKINGSPNQEINTTFNGERFELKHDWQLKKSGTAVLEISISDSKRTKQLRAEFPVYDAAELKKQNQELENEIAAVPAEIKKLTESKAKTAAELATLKKQKELLLNEIEAVYATQRQAKAKEQGESAKSVALPFTIQAPLRKTINLNGDQWQLTAAEKADGALTQYNPVPEAKSFPALMPFICFDKYFRSWFLPVSQVDPHNPYGAIRTLPGWEKFQWDDVFSSGRVWLSKEVTLDFSPSEYAVQFCADNIFGRARIYINGHFAAEYRGVIGPVNLPLPTPAQGKNRIDIFYEEPNKAGIPVIPSLKWGIRGNVELLFTAPVYTDLAIVRTSWRKNEISVETTISNRTAKPTTVRIAQYAVLNGKIRKQLPEKTVETPAGKMVTVNTTAPWSDPELWGIGDRCGSPVLYQLITDLYEGDKLVDRQTTEFGFREVWVAGTDLFLNGKRIILQGDVGVASALSARKYMNVLFPLLRAEGINTIRNHDSSYWNPDFFRVCDRLGMYAYANMYPVLHEGKPEVKAYIPYEQWLQHPYHQINQDNYRNWLKMVYNHPSVLVLSTDNEIFTQAWDRADQQSFNERNDRLGAWYGRFVKQLAPEYIHTRNGDVGTWGWDNKWHEDPPCETANYHYPNFDLQKCLVNWQTTFKFRPLIYGETLFCAYFIDNKWVPPSPELVAKRAQTLREIVPLYRQWEVPGQIYMGLSSDGFIKYDNTGKGNPFGITAAMIQNKAVPFMKSYPKPPVEWPAQSGPGVKDLCADASCTPFGATAINWFDPRFPSHIRTEVNDAYRNGLLPMPPLRADPGAECTVTLASGQANAAVSVRSAEHLSGQELVSLTDSHGKAYFELPRPGKYQFSAGNVTQEATISGMAGYAATPGFKHVPQITLKDK